jgi:hypothetical protein
MAVGDRLVALSPRGSIRFLADAMDLQLSRRLLETAGACGPG